MKKALALVLTVLMLVAMLASCQNADKPAEDTTTADPTETTTPAPETTTKAPETTTPAPETTTKAPETTTPAPETTVPEPVVTIPPVAEGMMVYYQDFESVGVTTDNDAAMAAIGWTIDTHYKSNTAKYSTVNGILTADNLSGSDDCYALIVDEAWMAPAATGNYTVQFDMKHVEVGAGDRYVALLTNYVPTEEGSYFSFHLRCCGYADYQPRINGDWNGRFDEQGEFDASNKAETAIVKRVLGVDYTDKNATPFLGKPLTVRIQLSLTAGPTVWIRDNSAAAPEFVKVSECTRLDKWEARRGNALALKVSKLMKAEIDNVAVWTGLGEMPTDTSNAMYQANIQSYLDAIKK